MSTQYRQEMNEKNLEKLRSLCSTMPGFIDGFVKDMQQNTEIKTRIAYVSDIKNFFEYYAKAHELNDIKDIDVYMLELVDKDFFLDYFEYIQGYSKGENYHSNNRVSIKRKLSSLRKLYTYLFINGYIKTNNIEKVSVPKLKHNEIVFLDKDEAADLIHTVEYGNQQFSKMESAYHDKLGIRDYTITTLLLSTGIRVSECVGLDISDVDLKNARIKVIRKGGNEAYVYYSDEQVEILSDYLEYRKALDPKTGSENALFLSSRMQRIGVRAVEILVKKYAEKSVPMKKITPHKLRSTYGTALYEATGDIYVTAESLGHKNVNTTQQFYANMSNTKKSSVRNEVDYSKTDSTAN